MDTTFTPSSSSSPSPLPLLLVASPSATTAALAEQLAALGCSVRHAAGAEAMLTQLATEAPPRVLLFDGPGALDALCRLRERSSLPAVALVPGSQVMQRVAALEAGADDALAHPVLARELLARLRAVQRRAQPGQPPPRVLHFHGWQFDRQTRQLRASSGLRVNLSHAECRLLLAFLSHPGSVLARDELMDLARGRATEAFERSIDLLVSRLRAKLADDPHAPRCIRTVRGVGYLFELFGLEGAAASADAHVSAAIPS